MCSFSLVSGTTRPRPRNERRALVVRCSDGRRSVVFFSGATPRTRRHSAASVGDTVAREREENRSVDSYRHAARVVSRAPGRRR